MRMPRIKMPDRTVGYHCTSRIVGGEFLLDEQCRQKLVELIKRQARFCGVQLVTYTIMSNHFHLLVRVPPKQEPDDQELLARMEALYGPEGKWVQLAREGIQQTGKVPEHLRRKMVARMGDVSPMLKEIKQRFSRWYNRRRGREGTLWSERFSSEVVEDRSEGMKGVAAYVDLNCVRAGLVGDPAEYRYSGYGVAVVGDEEVRKGLMSMYGVEQWEEAAQKYRMQLYVVGGRPGASGKVAMEREEIKKVLAEGGELEMGQVLRLRIRHFSDGLALGTEAFVEEVFQKYRGKFGARRKSGARRIRGVPMGELRVLRDLRVNAVS